MSIIDRRSSVSLQDDQPGSQRPREKSVVSEDQYTDAAFDDEEEEDQQQEPDTPTPTFSPTLGPIPTPPVVVASLASQKRPVSIPTPTPVALAPATPGVVASLPSQKLDLQISGSAMSTSALKSMKKPAATVIDKDKDEEKDNHFGSHHHHPQVQQEDLQTPSLVAVDSSQSTNDDDPVEEDGLIDEMKLSPEPFASASPTVVDKILSTNLSMTSPFKARADDKTIGTLPSQPITDSHPNPNPSPKSNTTTTTTTTTPISGPSKEDLGGPKKMPLKPSFSGLKKDKKYPW